MGRSHAPVGIRRSVGDPGLESILRRSGSFVAMEWSIQRRKAPESDMHALVTARDHVHRAVPSLATSARCPHATMDDRQDKHQRTIRIIYI